MTDFDRRVNTVGLLQMKAEGYGPRSPKSMLKAVDSISEPGVSQALADGFGSFREKVAQRILTEYSESIFINRCLRCNRIVRTPKAKLCTWCGYSWHEVDKVES
jgi:tRNA U34 2-thiouridine synthase MnmA/TrmU